MRYKVTGFLAGGFIVTEEQITNLVRINDELRDGVIIPFDQDQKAIFGAPQNKMMPPPDNKDDNTIHIDK